MAPGAQKTLVKRSFLPVPSWTAVHHSSLVLFYGRIWARLGGSLLEEKAEAHT